MLRLVGHPAASVDDRHRQGVLVGVNTGEHASSLVLLAGAAAGRAQASPGVRTPTPLLSVNSPDEPPPGGSHRSRASPPRAGSIRLSLPGGGADPSTTPRQTEHPRVHKVCSTRA